MRAFKTLIKPYCLKEKKPQNLNQKTHPQPPIPQPANSH